MNEKDLLEFHKSIMEDIGNGTLTMGETKRIRTAIDKAILKGDGYVNLITADILTLRKSLKRRVDRLFRKGADEEEMSAVRHAKHIADNMYFEMLPDMY